ncbi:hypothetical protein [Lactobacillus plantarum JDM1] [Lactiplantibacillus mudanjiangensis]|uniref:hypothetical protein n=1 Tax=Lactiplantibacillus mudanjiangensis TaxID=1296538 RepID=UPI0010152B0F|nr:hypothetical protein [Lactiplantibacillus mudanjiangensis]VDG32735.1 hypothetical protein [Lactobacillus plantarum JDM1] [Lactiplantibacillus mudanjiangensis]
MKSKIVINENLLIRILKKYLLTALLIGVLVSGIGVYASMRLQAKSYTSSGEMVQNDNNYNLISSYQQFVTSKKFLKIMDGEIAKSHWKNKTTKKDYDLTITKAASNSSSSPFFTLNVSSDDAEYSTYLAEIGMKMLVANIGEYLSGANISILSNASVGKLNTSHKKTFMLAVIEFVIAFLIASLWMIYKELYLGKVKDEEFIADVFHLNNLGVIEMPEKK